MRNFIPDNRDPETFEGGLIITGRVNGKCGSYYVGVVGLSRSIPTTRAIAEEFIRRRTCQCDPCQDGDRCDAHEG